MIRFNRAAPVFLFSLAAAADQLPAGPERDTVRRVCTACHASAVFTSQSHTKEEWSDIVGEMSNAGASASAKEFRQIVAYLARNFPKDAHKPPPKGK